MAAICCMLCLSGLTFAEVTEVQPIKGSLTGSKKDYQKATKDEVVLANFTNIFKESSYDKLPAGYKIGAYESTNLVVVGLTDELALDISNACYQQLVDTFTKANVKVKILDRATVEANKTYQKGLKKGGGINSGTVYTIAGSNRTEPNYKMAVPANVLNVNLGSGIAPNYVIFNWEVTKDTDALDINYIPQFSFAEISTQITTALAQNLNVGYAPKLTLNAGSELLGKSALNFMNGKYASYAITNPTLTYDGADWVKSLTYSEADTYFKLELEPENFKKAVLELNQAFAERYVAEFQNSLNSK